MDAGQELLPPDGREPRGLPRLLPALVRGARRQPAVRGHQADPRALRAVALPLQEARGRPAAVSFRAQHSRLVPVRAFFKWAARANLLLYNPASELELPQARAPAAQGGADRRRGRPGAQPAGHCRPARSAGPGAAGGLLLDGHAAKRADRPGPLRPRRRPRDGDGAPGQGEEGPDDPDRRAGAGLDRLLRH